MDIRLRAPLFPALLIAALCANGITLAEPVTPPQPQMTLSRALVEFKVKVLGIIQVTGWFHNVYESIADPDRKADLNPDITIEVQSVDTRHSLRDHFLRSPAFFDVDRFPPIHLSQVQISNGRNGRKQLHGNLTLHGMTQAVVFELAPVDRNRKRGKTHADDYAAYTTIKRTDFGLDGFRAAVSDDVEIVVYGRFR